MSKDRTINNLIITSIALTLVALALTYRHTQKNREANTWVNHTYEVISESTELLTYLVDAETGQRGYLITGDTAYLDPYKNAEKNQLQHFEKLQKLTIDNPQQQELLTSKIKPLLALKANKVKEAIFAFNRLGQDSAFAIIRTNGGKKLMDSLRFHLKVLKDREYALLEKRYSDLDEFYGIVDVARYVSLGIIACISALALMVLYQKQRQNRELIGRLKKFNEHLEEVVVRRTRELEEKNVATARLNDELQQSMEEIRSFYEALQLQNIKTEDAMAEVSDLYNHSPCGYHSLDSEGTFIRINATELEWLGYPREELMGKKLKDILSAESLPTWQAMYDDYKIKGSIYNAELQLIRKDGSIFPVLLNSTALYDVHGTFIMSRSTIFDLTERKEIELRLKEANENLIKVNQEKNNFLGMASHDLKSPLNSILGLINLMKLDAAHLTADQHENLNFVFDSAKQMKAMIDKLLDLNRIEQGRALAQKTEVEVMGLIGALRSVFDARAAKKNIQLIFESHPPALTILTDPALLNQILDNLISNALKFSTANKKVWVSATLKNDRVMIEIRDEGPGIKPEEFHRLFGKFQKLSARPTAGETSTGLGLSIVKELVGVLEGKISCKSEIGVGTVFIVEFPAVT